MTAQWEGVCVARPAVIHVLERGNTRHDVSFDFHTHVPPSDPEYTLQLIFKTL